MALQTVYNRAPAKAVAGMLYDTAIVRDTISKAAESAFPAGVFVVRGASEDVCTVPRGVDVDAIVASGASAATPQTITSLGGVIGAGAMTPSARLNLVLSSHADWDATTAVVTGTRNGATITENFAIPNGGNATVNGTKVFDTVTSVYIPAQSGTGGTFTLGVQGNYNTGAVPQSVLGVSWFDATKETGTWQPQDMVPILRKGRIWVIAEATVTAGDPAYMRVVASASQQLGGIRGAADGSDNVAIAGARFFTGATAGNLAVLELNL